MKVTNTIFILLSILIVVSLAISNSYIINLKGAYIDAERFLAGAEYWAKNGTFEIVIDSAFFMQFIGVFIRLGFSEFGLTLIGILMYFTAVFPFLSKLTFEKKLASFSIFFLVAFCPSLIFRLAALLREPYVIFFLFFGIFLISRWLQEERIQDLFFGFFLVSIAAMFHKAVLAFLPPLFLLAILFRIKWTPRGIMTVSIISIISMYILFEVLLTNLGALRGGQALSVILSGDFSSAEQIVDYKRGRNFRTTYDYGPDWSSLSNIIKTIIKANYFFYLKPFPTDISNLSDIIAFIENTIRLFLIFIIIKEILRNEFDKRSYFILFCYLGFNAIWALGTSNYGTGSRHHMTSLPLLFMLYYYLFSKKGKKDSQTDFDRKVLSNK